ncbi:siderophore ABC transporter substrate-binding protein [Palleronia abyssalis]|uniref:Putative ABC transporter solute-binding protein YclQ n=1 Tax=Palleronia abyssalis TaxID=1501240 RepID=A0A2R8BYU0_9RHOB|nr:siderophore ABC transporter substrate-binding protein [Palleronia abyssalis]SPJ25302.1 putative ABC transporter solute-binding protein YclQ [Palleronia abyssalis]
MKTIRAAGFAAALPFAAFAQGVEVQTATGPSSAPATPETVAVFDLAAIDTISALGVTIDGVPGITPPAYLSEAMSDAEIVGTLFEPDFEALAVMAPDLIVAGGRSQTKVDALSRIAPTLDMTIDGTDLLQEAKLRAEAYGAIFGQEEAAAELISALETDVADASNAVEGKGDALILLANGGKISAYGAGSRFGWIHAALGLEEARDGLEAETHGEAVSFEFVAETDPDWILVIDRGAAIGQEGEAARATLDNPLVQGTKAGQSGQIVYLESAPLYLAGGGVQSMRLTLDEITEAFSAAGS